MHSFIEHFLEYWRSDSGFGVQQTALDRVSLLKAHHQIKVLRQGNFSDLEVDPTRDFEKSCVTKPFQVGKNITAGGMLKGWLRGLKSTGKIGPPLGFRLCLVIQLILWKPTTKFHVLPFTLLLPPIVFCLF